MLQLTQLSGNLNFISELPDEPNIDAGLSAAQLKAKFDLAGNTIKQYINTTLLPQLAAGVEAELQTAAYPLAASIEAANTQLSTTLPALSAQVTANHTELLATLIEMTDILHARIDELEAQINS
ncbi:MAG: hypothetical protein LBO63_02550 [Oscillospiraceae bacterium]|jgi:hypothetical protein|nr:hypothetical protein [Oscillospiraceae bacterium]